MTKKVSDTHTKPCRECPLMRNTLNGHLCTRLNILTEYAKTKPCEDFKH